MLLGVGLLCKFLFVGAHSNPGPTGSTPPNGGNSLNNLAGASKQKLLLGWVCIAKLYFGGPTGSTPPNGGICFENWAGASKQKLLLAVGLQSKILFLRVHLTSGPTHSKGGICSSLFRSLETCPSRSCYWVLWVIGGFPHFCQFDLCCNLIN
jgi:hypothetical protein